MAAGSPMGLLRRRLQRSGPKPVKRSLCDIVATAKEYLSRNEFVVEADTKRLSLQEFRDDDQILGKAFRDLESHIASLQLDIADSRDLSSVDTTNDRFTEAMLLPGQVSTTLWGALESKYEALLKYLTAESVEDVLRSAACQLWEREAEEWNAQLEDFEQSLVESLNWAADTKRVPKGPSVGAASAARPPPMTANDRLLLNIMRKHPLERSPDAAKEIVRLSVSSLPSTLRDFCGEIWEVLICLCGKHPKSGMEDPEDLRDFVFNAIRCTEDLCRHQILYQLQVSVDIVSDDKLLEYLKLFCCPDRSTTYPSEPGHFWQLAYWSYRCGCTAALNSLITLLQKPASGQVFHDPQDVELLSLICDLLIRRLLAVSRSPRAERDAPWESTLQSKTLPFQTDPREETQLMARMLELLGTSNAMMNPIATLLTSCLSKDGNSVGLRNVMPSATAEDFVWYNLTLLSMKPHERLLEDLTRLQSKILVSGPHHFEVSGGTSAAMAFTKIASVVLAPTAAIDWLTRAQPELSVFCLYWLTYLAQYGLCGTKSSITHCYFPELANFSGSSSLGPAFEEVLTNHSPPSSAVQLCELLPYGVRRSVLGTLLNSCKTVLFEDQDESDRVVGAVSPDGACRGGLLFRSLMAEDWNCPGKDPTQHRQQAHEDFEHIVASLSESAASKGLLLPAITYSYLICQDRAALKFLLQAFCSPAIFPHLSPLTTAQAHQQELVKRFYSVLQRRVACGELEDLASTFEVVRTARLVASVFELSCSKQFEAAWDLILQHDLFPDNQLAARWQRSELSVFLIRLVEVAGHCLKVRVSAGTKLGQGEHSEIKARANVLIETLGDLGQSDTRSGCLALLRSLLL